MKLIIYSMGIPVLCLVFFTTLEGQEMDESISIEYAQLVVRDSDGTLVTYLETSRIREIDSKRIDESINSDSTKIINSEEVKAAGILQERIIFETEPILYPTESQRGVTILGIIKSGIGLIGATFMNDGYFHLEDDKISVIWTALKPLE